MALFVFFVLFNNFSTLFFQSDRFGWVVGVQSFSKIDMEQFSACKLKKRNKEQTATMQIFVA